eukprot:TRINITY_DN2775_c0_g1_i1.p1 TRINITY_DN2775_c0_g1~~TRINITY_DN2775_c0_g1_i1.p1  ORF type:complete len:355 (+),score=60.37 TRINITY_DN2775_c0_g1_i1:1-1065(+)
MKMVDRTLSRLLGLLVALLSVALVLAPCSALSAVSSIVSVLIHGIGISYQCVLFLSALLHDLPMEVSAAHSLPFANQTITITGASSGIGAEMARQLAKANTTLFLAARRMDRLQAVAKECKALGAFRVVTISYDAGDASSGSHLARSIQKHTGGQLDVVILNAGMPGPWTSSADVSDDGIQQRVVDVNFMGYVRATQAFLPLLKASHGRLVAVSSVLGQVPAPYQAIYSASKHAVNGYFNTLRLELREHDVSVTLHSPGGIQTEFQQRLTTADSLPAFLTMPATMLESAKLCAESILQATWQRDAYGYYPQYARFAIEARQAMPTWVDAGLNALMQWMVASEAVTLHVHDDHQQ